MQSNEDNRNALDVGTSQGIAYALPMMIVAFMFGPVVLVQGIYAKYFGISLGFIALVTLIGRIFDAFTDPLIGYWSDRRFWRTGSRKPLIVAGAVAFMVSCLFLYAPHGFVVPDTPQKVSELYFLGFFLVFYLAYTIFDIPHSSWGRDVTAEPSSRNLVFTFRAMAATVGMLLFFSVPMLPVFEGSSFTPTTLAWSALIACLLMGPVLIFSVWFVPSRARPQAGTQGHPQQEQGKSLISALKAVVQNKPFLIFVGAFFSSGAGLGMWFGMMFLHVDVYLNMGEHLSFALVVSYAVSILVLYPFYKLANQFGKKAIWRFGILLLLVGMVASGFLQPNSVSRAELLACMILINVGMVIQIVIAPALLSDIIDYGALKSGSDYGGTYFSLYSLFLKLNLGFGGAVGLWLSAYLGFDPLLAGAEQSKSAVIGILLSVSWIPAGLALVSIVFISLIPINAQRYAVIRKRLDINALRQEKTRSEIGEDVAVLSSADQLGTPP